MWNTEEILLHLSVSYWLSLKAKWYSSSCTHLIVTGCH